MFEAEVTTRTVFTKYLLPTYFANYRTIGCREFHNFFTARPTAEFASHHCSSNYTIILQQHSPGRIPRRRLQLNITGLHQSPGKKSRVRSSTYGFLRSTKGSHATRNKTPRIRSLVPRETYGEEGEEEDGEKKERE